MNSGLLEILVDPKTKEPLTLNGAVYKNGEIEEGVLSGPSGNKYFIKNGIPRFVNISNYTGSFGLQWNRFARTQLDSVTGRDYSRKRFENEVGWEKPWAKGKWVLDSGCGSGRFAEIAAGLECNLVAIDMSSAIDAAKFNLSGLRNINFVQADIFNLPFRRNSFEGVYCIGVLQHTPDPYLALRCLLDILSPGGKFAFTAYARQPWTKFYSKYWVRSMLHGMKDEELLRKVEAVMPVAFPVTDVLFRMPVLDKLMRFLIPVANYVEKSDLTRKQRYEEAVLDTFDMLSPRFDSPVTAEQVIDVLTSRGIEDYTMKSRCPMNVTGNTKGGR